MNIEILAPFVIQEFSRRSKILKEIVNLFEDKKYIKTLSLIEIEEEKFLNDDDPYYIDFLYSVLIRIYLVQNNSEKVVFYTNEILKNSGMVLFEYVGKYSPFEKSVIDKVIKCYDELYKKDSSKIECLWGKGRILHFLNKLDESSSLYEKALKINPNDIMTLRMQGRLYEEESKYSKALRNYYKIKELDTADITINCFIANVYEKLSNNEYAKDLLCENLKVNPNHTVTLFRLCCLYHFLKEEKEVKKIRNKIKSLCPYNLKYCFFTTDIKDENILDLYNEIMNIMKEGYDYSVALEFLGNYYFDKYKEYGKKENLINAIEYYEEQLEKKYYSRDLYQKIFTAIVIFLNVCDEDCDEYNKYYQKYKDILQKIRSNIFYDDLFVLECNLVNKTSEEKIEELNKYKNKYDNNVNYYELLRNAYKENDDKENEEQIILEMKKKFPESFFVYVKDYFFNLENKNYVKTDESLKKIMENYNLLLEKKYSYKTIDELLILNSFFKEPEKYSELINKYKNILSVDSYKDLLVFYFNLCYDKKYIDYASDIIENIGDEKFNEADYYLLIALIYQSSEKNKEAQKYFSTYMNLVKNEEDALLKSIQICGDIFDISSLLALYLSCSKVKETKNIKILKFYTSVVLYLLHYLYLQDEQKYYEYSHYTSVSVISKMLDENEKSKVRLSSIMSTNDPHEGKVLISYLNEKDESSDIYVKDTYVFQTSFTLLQDALTMFRLYGKKDSIEGTGINIVFTKKFFSQDLCFPKKKSSEKLDIKQINNEEEKSHKTMNSEDQTNQKIPLYYVLYYDKTKNHMVFYPFDLYKGALLDLNKEVKWSIINQTKSTINIDEIHQKYLDNIIFVFQELKKGYKSVICSENDFEKEEVKKILLDINFLVKDIAFVDEKELRMIDVCSSSNKILHDNDRYTLYKNYLNVCGKFNFTKEKMIKKIILGPKVEQKNTVKEFIENHLSENNLNNVEVSFSKAPLA